MVKDQEDERQCSLQMRTNIEEGGISNTGYYSDVLNKEPSLSNHPPVPLIASPQELCEVLD